jgi:hypothetical protein
MVRRQPAQSKGKDKNLLSGSDNMAKGNSVVKTEDIITCFVAELGHGLKSKTDSNQPNKSDVAGATILTKWNSPWTCKSELNRADGTGNLWHLRPGYGVEGGVGFRRSRRSNRDALHSCASSGVG